MASNPAANAPHLRWGRPLIAAIAVEIVLIAITMALFANGSAADFDLESSIRPANLLAHGLKVVGGVIGGWLIARKIAANRRAQDAK